MIVIKTISQGNREKQRLKKKSWFALSFSEVLTLVISGVGLFFVVITLRSNEQAVSTGNYLQTYGWTLEIDKLFIEHPNYRRYFINGDSLKAPAGSEEYARVQAMADYMLNNLDAVLNNTSYFNRNPGAEKAWKEAVGGYFSSSPVLCERFLIDPGAYNSALLDAYHIKPGSERGSMFV